MRSAQLGPILFHFEMAKVFAKLQQLFNLLVLPIYLNKIVHVPVRHTVQQVAMRLSPILSYGTFPI